VSILKADIQHLLAKIKETEAPLRRQLLLLAVITLLLRRRGKPAPVLVGGCALSYYSREVYFTADIDLAYADREVLDEVLRELEFSREGRYWVNRDLDLMVEVPAASLAGEEAHRETVELGEGLECTVLGIEDLLIDRMNACRHWKSEADCEMVELLVARYESEIDWDYLLKRAALPENDTVQDFRRLNARQR
jgi:hypothetical protein